MKKYLYFSMLLFCSITFGQSWQWIKRGGSIANPENSFSFSETITAMETDNQGNVYVVSPVTQYGLDIDGNTKTGYGFKDDVIASFTCDGNYRWSTIVGGAGNDRILNIKVDSNGDVFAVMNISWGNEFDAIYHFDASTTIPLVFENQKILCFAKYNGQTGNVLWYKFLQADGLTPIQYSQSSINSLDIDNNNNLYLFCSFINGVYYDGAFNNTSSGSNKFILKCDNNGNFISASNPFQASYSNGNYYSPYNIKRSPLNGKYYYRFSSLNSYNGITVQPNQKFFLMCISSNGNFEWLKTVSFTNTGNRAFTDMKIDNDGFIYLSGGGVIGDDVGGFVITGTSTYDCPFLLKLDPDGNVIWGSNATMTPGAASEEICRLGINGNQIAVSPYFHAITWGGNYPHIPNNGRDSSLFMFNKTNGSFISNTRLTSTSGVSERINQITSDIHGNYIVGGYFETNITANSTTLNSVGGGSDFFVAKYGSNNCTLSNEEQEQNIKKAVLFPNPAHETIFINTNEKVGYTIFNLLGKKVATGYVDNVQVPIPVTQLASGSYIMQIKDNNNKIKQVKFVKN